MCNTCASKHGPAPAFKVVSGKKGIKLNSHTGILPRRNEFKNEGEQLEVFYTDASRSKLRTKPIKLRKSCDFCWRRKLRCEGGSPCHNCTIRSIVCNHSPRKQRGKHDDVDSADSQNSNNGNISPSSVDLPEISFAMSDVPEHALLIPNDLFQTDLANMEKVGSLGYTMTRARISPSSATGLVGLTEHSYLTTVLEDFLYVFPFVDQSILREALVNIMDGKVKSSPPVTGFEAFSFDVSGEIEETRGDRDLRLCASSRDAIVDYQASCAKQAIFWGSVATGALLMGSPVETVMKYVVLAEAQLKECFDANDEYTADAYMMLAFMHLLLQDHAKYFRYLSFSNNLWIQLPANRRPNLRFVYMVCGLMSHVYGHADTRVRLILASLDEVHDGPICTDNVRQCDRLLDDIERIPTKPDIDEADVKLELSSNDPTGIIATRQDLIVPKPMKDIVKGIIGTFHTSYGSALYDPFETNVLSNQENMKNLHQLFSNVHERVCLSPTSPASFRIIVSSWLMVTKLALGRYNELLEQAENMLAAVEELPGLTRMTDNSHKCHNAFVVFRLFNQPNLYARLRRIHNSYCMAELIVPPYDELTCNHCSSCSSPFCRSVCTEMWKKLEEYTNVIYSLAIDNGNKIDIGNNYAQSIGINSNSYQSLSDYDSKSRYYLTPAANLPSIKSEKLQHGPSFESGMPFWEVESPVTQNFNANSKESIPHSASFNSLLNSFPDHWFENDFLSFGQTDARF